jgi:flagellar biosynthesis protein FlhG
MINIILEKIRSLFRTKEQEQIKPKIELPKPSEALVEDVLNKSHLRKQLWAIGGGKGGIGKSLITLMLGATLTRWDKKVIIVDADLGGSNINLLVGIRNPAHTLEDFIFRRTENIGDVALDTPVENLKVICGAGDILGMANPKSTQKARLFKSLTELEADIILLDLGAGTSFATLDFFLFASHKLLVLSPQTTAIQNAYGFLKSCLYRKLTQEFNNDPQCLELIKKGIAPGDDSISNIEDLISAFDEIGEGKQKELKSHIDEMNVGLIVNMVREGKDVHLGRSLIDVANKYLSINPEYMGFIEYSAILDRSVNRMASFLSDGSDIMTKIGFYDLANKVIRKLYKESRGLSKV